MHRSDEQLLAHLDTPAAPVTIVAESFSGPLAIRLAARHPEQVRALVLVATFVRCPSTTAGWLHALLGRQAFRLRPPDIALRLGLQGMDAAADEVAELRTALQTVEPGVLAARPGEIVRVDVRQDFARNRTPCLHLAGRHDRLVRAGAVAEMKRLRPDMGTHQLDAPLLVLQRGPAEAARLISDFLVRRCT